MKVKYYYDSENPYRKIKIKKRNKFGFVILGGIGLVWLSYIYLIKHSYFDTPKDRLLIVEIENLKLNYAVLNKKMNQLDNVIEAIEDRDNNLYQTYFNHIKKNVKSGLSGTDRYADLQGYNNTQLVLNTKNVQSLDYKLAKRKISYCLPFLPFIRNENLKQYGFFGYRTDPFTKARKMHEGMDFTALNLCNWRRYRSTS
jgi:murein DD-endopeptidase MepM/ murein hydrolase activator NlpD